MYTFLIFNNGREVENLDAGTYATESEAMEAGNSALDDLCPPGSPMRCRYYVGTRTAEKPSGAPGFGADRRSTDDGTNDTLDADWRDELPQERRGFTVRADVHSDDFRQRCDFDAAPWLEKASDEEIVKLAGCDWGGDYPADAVAYGLEATSQGISDVLKYCCDAHKYGITMGFEVQVHSDDALAWLGEHRPHILDILDVLADEPTEAPTQD